MEKRCTTCHYFQIPLPQRWCGHPKNHKPIMMPFRPCEYYVHMTDKSAVTRYPKKSYADTMEAMTCRI